MIRDPTYRYVTPVVALYAVPIKDFGTFDAEQSRKSFYPILGEPVLNPFYNTYQRLSAICRLDFTF
jgi:hypothetical protein